ncbi:hypothetical protein N7474_000814 [Penicillium riverlandense]|uniref:uncharacterized protein n=1 Tax=Penicillium riverlandense TaxID=1903569 RepID=UPI002549BAA7|nr:uncharacterized protein N7474_000814 [Penicillium riverlandense]KAJ5832503.1 hypothetical protein N7474_000814 [Penicillium riverlandense]
MLFAAFLATVLGALVAADGVTIVPEFAAEWATDLTIMGYASTAASVAGINALYTTYHINCLDDAPKTDCQIDTPWTLIEGPGTYSVTGVYTGWSSGDGNAVTATRLIDCTFTSSSLSASCSANYKATGTIEGLSYSTSTAVSTSSIPTDSITYLAMYITAGAKSFTEPQATQTPGAAFAAAKPLITAAPLGAAAAVAIAALF